MVRPRKNEQNALSNEQIKAAARLLMADHGTAGLTLRGIARALNVTAPAIYNYFPRLEDLITALIVDAYHHQAETLEEANCSCADRQPAARLLAVLLAYRAWAIAHPVEFALIYGTPIPGYHAPVEKTLPAAQRNFNVILSILAEAHEMGCLKPLAEQSSLPEGLSLSLPGNPLPLAPEVIYIGVTGWYHIHGMIMLESFGHIREIINDPALYYEHEVKTMMASNGLVVAS